MNYGDINKELLEKYKIKKDKKIISEIVNANIGLVKSITKLFSVMTLSSYEDLYQEGCLGLLYAIERYDANKNTKFSTYAVSYILGYQKKYLTNNRYLLHVPKNLVEKIIKYDKLNDENIYPKEMLKYMNMTESQFEKFLKQYEILSNLKVVNIDKSIRIDKTDDIEQNDLYMSLEDNLEDDKVDVENSVIDKITYDSILEELEDKLTELELKAIMLKFGFNGYKSHTVNEIASIFNVTDIKIKEILKTAKEKLKQDKNMKYLLSK